MLTIWLLLAITVLPGAVIFRFPFADRSRRAALPIDERAFWMVVTSVIISTTVTFVLAAMGAYTIERLALFNTLLAIGLAIASGGNLRLTPKNGSVDWTAVLPVALVALSVWMYFGVPCGRIRPRRTRSWRLHE